MQAISRVRLTLNSAKCQFGKNEISFSGMIYSKDGVHPDPEKVEALEHLQAPTNKQELISSLCMMQSNADFIPNFAKKSSKLRELTRGRVRFRWGKEYGQCFRKLIQEFRKDVLLRYFDPNQPIYVTEEGLGPMLAQGNSVRAAKPVAVASCTTNATEKKYSQLDLEATGLDFGPRRFRHYLVGTPHTVSVVTDHKPLCSILNGNRQGSIRTDRIKMMPQDIRFKVQYQKGIKNQTDFMSRNARPLSQFSNEEQNEADDINNILYMLHATPIIDYIGLSTIAEHTTSDPILKISEKLSKEGKHGFPKILAQNFTSSKKSYQK